MEDIYALLNINKSVLQDFYVQADNIVDHQTELAINRNMRTLKNIEERMMADKSVSVPQQTIDEIIKKVIQNAKENNKDMSIWSIRELRIVSYYLMKLQDSEGTYEYALSLLNTNWKDMFFNGLSFYCLNTWNMIDPELRALTCELLTKKLKAYTDNNKKYIAMKNHADLFDEAGPRRLCALLSHKKQYIEEAPSYFNNKPATISQSYYSDVIVNFFETNKIIDLDRVESIFKLHNNDRTKKLLFADLVFRINNSYDELKRTQLCKFANRILGDITLSSTWAPFVGATEQDVQKLRKAKKLVNLWFSRKIIETFFEVCVQDRDRKEFWLEYVEYINAFKIVGSTITKKLLLADSRVNSIFLPHFIETDSRTSQTSALVLFIKNKMIIEFSDIGAVYAYDQEHEIVKLITNRRRQINSTADLKIPSMNNLVDKNSMGYYNIYHGHGRMTHQGYWQSRLKGWMHTMVLSANNITDSFFNSKDNETFKAKPIIKERHKPTPPPSTSSQEVYEANISWNIASKWIAQDKCRIVCNRKGFYVSISQSKRYVHIRPLADNTNPTGLIRIKKPRTGGWQPVIHSIGNKDIPIGYIKEMERYLLYKQEQEGTNFVKIKF